MVRPTLISLALTSNTSSNNGSKLAFIQANKGKHLQLDLKHHIPYLVNKWEVSFQKTNKIKSPPPTPFVLKLRISEITRSEHASCIANAACLPELNSEGIKKAIHSRRLSIADKINIISF